MTSEETAKNEAVSEALAAAQKQYEEYIRLARLAQSSVIPEPKNPSDRDWSHPLTLVVRSSS